MNRRKNHVILQTVVEILLVFCCVLTKSIYNTGRIIVLDSGFCILQGLIELRKIGLFAHAVIKKRRYWPRYVKGNILMHT